MLVFYFIPHVIKKPILTSKVFFSIPPYLRNSVKMEKEHIHADISPVCVFM